MILNKLLLGGASGTDLFKNLFSQRTTEQFSTQFSNAFFKLHDTCMYSYFKIINSNDYLVANGKPINRRNLETTSVQLLLPL